MSIVPLFIFLTFKYLRFSLHKLSRTQPLRLKQKMFVNLLLQDLIN